jgi:hypothetical protein
MHIQPEMDARRWWFEMLSQNDAAAPLEDNKGDDTANLEKELEIEITDNPSLPPQQRPPAEPGHKPEGSPSLFNEPFYQTRAVYLDTLIPSIVSNLLFDIWQFPPIGCDHWGSEWQKIVCEELEKKSGGMFVQTPTWKERYWNERGLKNVTRSLNRRRSCVTRSMKTAFIGKLVL